MAEGSRWTPLASLPRLVDGAAAANAIVAWRGGVALGPAAFARRVAAWRSALAAQPGVRWALHGEDTWEFAATLFGAWHAGKAIVLPGDAQPDTLARLRGVTDGFLGDLPGALPTPADLGEPPDGPDDRSTWPALDRVATKLTLYTSGTTGEPLAIDKCLAQLDAEVHALEVRFGALCDTGRVPVNQDPDPAAADDGIDFGADAGGGAEPACVWSTVSHQHIYGLLFRVLWPLAAGRPFVNERIDYPEQIAQRLAGRAVLVSSPAHLGRLPQGLEWDGANAALQAVFSSGGPLDAEAAESVLGVLGVAPVEVYGSSETGGVAWRQRARHGETWQPLPGVAFRIEDGELSVRSPHLPDAQWWRTADRAAAAGDGMDGFELLGRADRIAKIGDKRVSLTAIENRLVESGVVAAVRVLMLASTTATAVQRPVVVASLTEAGRHKLRAHGKAALVDALRAALLEGVDRLALPRRWRFVDALPTDAQGKTAHSALVALFDKVRPRPAWHAADGASATAHFDVDADLAVFDGHFPDRPILPGVAQVDWAIAWGIERFGIAAPFLRLEALKFLLPVEPGMRLEGEWHWDAATATLRFEFRSQRGLHCGGRAVFGERVAEVAP
jgi:acyl-CoA synthetase (AMP-forming)/AMP-acid ligase II